MNSKEISTRKIDELENTEKMSKFLIVGCSKSREEYKKAFQKNETKFLANNKKIRKGVKNTFRRKQRRKVSWRMRENEGS